MTEVEIYTDGACRGNPGPGGWAALLIAGSERKELSGAEAGDHQQPHGAHGRDRRLGGAQAPLRGAALYRFEVRAAGRSPSGCRSGRRAAGAPQRANLSRIRIYGRCSMRPRRRKISNGTGSRDIRAMKATSTSISSRTGRSIGCWREHEEGSAEIAWEPDASSRSGYRDHGSRGGAASIASSRSAAWSCSTGG